MTAIVDPALEAYATEHTSAPPAYLEDLAADVVAELESPGMMVGRLEGRFLELLVYALGRGLEFYDLPVARDIARQAAKQNFKFSAVVIGIAKSTPFQMKKVPAPQPAQVAAR